MRRLFRVCSIGSGVSICVMALIVFYAVTKRYVFHDPVSWYVEIASYLMTFCVFSAQADTQSKKGHVNVDLLVVHLPKRVSRVFSDLVNPLSSLVCGGILIWFTGRAAWRSWQIKEVSTSDLALPLFPVQIIVPIGLSLLCLAALIQIVDYLRQRPGAGSR